MTKSDARSLIVVLATQRIPFTWRMEHHEHIVAFPLHLVDKIVMSIGDLPEKKPIKKRRRSAAC